MAAWICLLVGSHFAAAKPSVVASPVESNSDHETTAKWKALPKSAEDRQDETDAQQPSSKKENSKNGAPTFGGWQFWTDQHLFRGWRIQKNAVTGHCRLLDERNRRHAVGDLDACRAALLKIREQRQLRPMTGEIVILLHGLGDHRAVMSPIHDSLADVPGFTVLNMSYASTRSKVADLAAGLSNVISGLEGESIVHLVGYSLGGIVIRYYLGNQQRLPPEERHGRVSRVVMLGTPNQGARLADRLGKENALFNYVLGPGGQALGGKWSDIAEKLATPTEFGIVAGRLNFGGNPLIPGNDDYVVGVEEAKLPGAADFITLRCEHVLLPKSKLVHAWLKSFLKNGYFVAADRRQALPIDRGDNGEKRR